MEDAIFQQLDEFNDYNDDYESLIKKLNRENVFRSFGDGLLYFIQKKNPDISLNDAISYIEDLCNKNNVPIKDIASSNTLKNWFKGGPRPKKGDDSRKSMFALAFALNLNTDETAELFHKVYFDRAFDYRNEKEIIYYFCLQNNKTWDDATRLINSLNKIKNCDDLTVYTSQIYLDLQSISEETALLSYIKKHGNNLSKKSITAKGILGKLKAESIEMVEKETKLQAERAKAERDKKSKTEMYEDKLTLQSFKNTNTRSLNHIYEVITGCLVRGDKGTKTLFKNARLPKEIKNRFPEAATLSKKEPTYEEIRKLIILLFSYNFWVKTIQCNKLIDIDVYIDELNVFLDESGFSLMYYGNPYDWLFLYCTLSDRPLDTFRAILTEVLESEE